MLLSIMEANRNAISPYAFVKWYLYLINYLALSRKPKISDSSFLLYKFTFVLENC